MFEENYRKYKPGYFILNKGDLDALKRDTNHASGHYELYESGDTAEGAKVECMRLRHPSIKVENAPESVNLFDSPAFLSFLSNETGIANIKIDRIQSHFYEPGYFIEKHVDQDSCADYRFSIILCIEKAEEGGEVVAYTSQGEEKISLDQYELLLMKSDLPHSIEMVSKGNRQAVCAFIRSL